MIQFRRIGLALAAVAALLMMPVAASAATTGTANQTLNLTGGSLSMTAPTDTIFPSTAIALGTLTSGINPADYTDATASGVGWSATIAVQKFHIVNSWAATSGSTVLINNSSTLYLGTQTADIYTMHVTAASLAASPTVAVSWPANASDIAGVASCTKGVGCQIGTMGLAVDFTPAVAFAATDTYTSQVGTLGASALRLASGSTTITGSANPPAAVGGTSTITTGAGFNFGAPVKFVSAAPATGSGTYTVTPGVTLTWPTATGAVWAAAYASQANYSMVSGP